MSSLTPITLDPDLNPWDRQPGETIKKHGQFAVYRGLGRARSLPMTAERLQMHPVSVRKIAIQYRWRERVEAYDQDLDRQYDEMWLEERRKAAETDAKILGAAIGKLAQRLTSLNAAELSAGDFIRLMDVTMRHRRVLFGDPTETIAVTGEGSNPLAKQFADFAQMPPDLRRARLAELTAQVTQRIRAVDESDNEEEENT